MSDSLFSEFESVSAKQWKQKIQVDLKGEDYNEKLVWQSLEGVHVKPYYHKDDFPQGFQTIPGQPKEWSVVQHIFIDDEAISNRLLLDAINRGAEAVYLTTEKVFDIEKVFQNFGFQNTSIYFNIKFLEASFLNKLIALPLKLSITWCVN